MERKRGKRSIRSNQDSATSQNATTSYSLSSQRTHTPHHTHTHADMGVSGRWVTCSVSHYNNYLRNKFHNNQLYTNKSATYRHRISLRLNRIVFKSIFHLINANTKNTISKKKKIVNVCNWNIRTNRGYNGNIYRV